MALSACPNCGHEWSPTSYQWMDDGCSCIAVRSCPECGCSETAVAPAALATLREPTCTEVGVTALEAVFEEEWAERQVHGESEIPKAEHAWSKVVYDWTRFHDACTASRRCETCGREEKAQGWVSAAPIPESEMREQLVTATFSEIWARTQEVRTPILYELPEPGTLFTCGAYLQDAEEPQPIVWRTLAVDGEQLVAVSQKVLDFKRFDCAGEDAPEWESSSLKAWLEGEFAATAFDDAFSGGLSCLTAEDAAHLFKNDEDRIAASTEHARSLGAQDDPGTEGCGFWLRTPAQVPQNIAAVFSVGSVTDLGLAADRPNGVRPVLGLSREEYSRLATLYKPEEIVTPEEETRRAAAVAELKALAVARQELKEGFGSLLRAVTELELLGGKFQQVFSLMEHEDLAADFKMIGSSMSYSARYLLMKLGQEQAFFADEDVAALLTGDVTHDAYKVAVAKNLRVSYSEDVTAQLEYLLQIMLRATNACGAEALRLALREGNQELVDACGEVLPRLVKACTMTWCAMDSVYGDAALVLVPDSPALEGCTNAEFLEGEPFSAANPFGFFQALPVFSNADRSIAPGSRTDTHPFELVEAGTYISIKERRRISEHCIAGFEARFAAVVEQAPAVCKV